MAKAPEEHVPCGSMEDARNRAIAFLEAHGGPLGPHYKVHLSRRVEGAQGYEDGIVNYAGEADDGAGGIRTVTRELRLDWDAWKGCHYNALVKGEASKAFSFPSPHEAGSDAERAWIARILRRRGPPDPSRTTYP